MYRIKKLNLSTRKEVTFQRCAFIYANNKRCTKIVHFINHMNETLCQEHLLEHERKRTKSTQELNFFKTICNNLKPPTEFSNINSFSAYKNVDSLLNIHAKLPSKLYINKDDTELVTQNLLPSCNPLWSDRESSESDEMDTDDNLKNSRVLTEEEVQLNILNNLNNLWEKYHKEKIYLEHLYKQLDVVHKVKGQSDDDLQLNDFEKLQLKTWKNYVHNHELTRLTKSNDEQIQQQIERQKSYLKSPSLETKNQNCLYIDDVISCDKKRMKYSKYCKRHIAKSTKQNIFRECGVQINDMKCEEPILDIDKNAHCILHDLL